MERIFNRSGRLPMLSTADPEDYYTQYIQNLIEDTIDFEESVLAPQRDKATKYYYGVYPTLEGDNDANNDLRGDPDSALSDIDADDSVNRSSIVSTDVRDAILSVIPSLVRIFASTENVVTLEPRRQTDVPMAKQATDYVNYTFWEDNDGFLILYGVFKDVLTLKAAFVKWRTDNIHEVKYKTYQNVHVETMTQTLQEAVASGMQVQVQDKPQPDPQTGILPKVTVKYVESKPKIIVEGVPNEEMRIDRYATTFAKSRIVGHERVISLDEAVAMGYDRDEMSEYVTSADATSYSDERSFRNAGLDMSNKTGDGIIWGEWYIRADQDGDGIAELRFITTVGDDRAILNDEPANRIKFAHFSMDPKSHTIIGDSMEDLVEDIQRVKTNIVRGTIDSLAESMNPKMVINELFTNLDDAMNDDLGAIIRTRGDPASSVMYQPVPFVGQQALPILENLDLLASRRTGLSDAAKGLDPKALQSSATIGVDAILQGAQERIELIAYILANTGFRVLFKGIFDEVCENPNEQRELQINGQWKQYDTSLFDDSMHVRVNPTMGKGSAMSRLQALQSVKADQQTIIGKWGIKNPVVGPNEVLNVITDMLEIVNIRDVSRYFRPIDPATMQQIMTAPDEPDPLAVSAKAQFEKVRSDTSKAVGDQNYKDEKLKMDDNFRRDKLQLDAEMTAASLQVQENLGQAKILSDQQIAQQAQDAANSGE